MADFVHDEDLLIRYLDGELSGNEKQAVEQRLQTDEAFRNQYMNLQIAVQAIRQMGATQQVAAVHGQMMQELKGVRPATKVVSISKAVRYTMAVAASILVLFIGVRIYLGSQVSGDKIYNETFVEYTVATERGNTHLTTVEDLYAKKNYSGVIASAHTLNLSAQDSLLIGLSYLNNNNFSSAINWFQHLSTTANNYQQDAEFYLAMSYLKNKEYAKALPLMQSIYQNSNHIYHERISADAIEKVKKLSEK